MAGIVVRTGVLLVLACTLTAALSRSGSAHAAQYSVLVAPELREIRCNGDALRVTVTVTKSATGDPVAGAGVTIAMPDGVSTARIGTSTGTTVSGQTNSRGVLRALLTPARGTKTSFLYVVGVAGGPSPHLSAASCPFSNGGAFTLSGKAFLDFNGDGSQGRHDMPAFFQAVEIYGLCENSGCIVPVRTDRANVSGHFGFTGLSEGSDIRCCLATGEEFAIPTYFLCVPERWGQTIVSLNGAPLSPEMVQHIASLDGHPITPSSCVYAGILHSGDNRYAIGIGWSP